MFKHYLKITFRNMWKYKTQSLTSIFGLAFGIACFVPALYWIRYETSYDSFYPDAKDIYRIYAVDKKSGKVNELVPGILEKKLHEHFPGTEISTTFYPEVNNCSTQETPHIRLRTLNTLNSSFFKVFPQEFVSGDANQPLETMYNMVITESVALSLFGDVEKAIGQKIQSTFYFFNPPYTVTAVIKDPPGHSNLSFDALLFHDLQASLASAPEEFQWVQFTMQFYVRFHPDTDVDVLAEQLRDFTTRLNANENIEVRMVPIDDVRHRLNAGLPFTLNFVRLFVAAGILLLFSAIFNFLNLNFDLFRQRLRELHQRTVHGATSGKLIRQMLFELICAILLSLFLGATFIMLVRPVFSGLLGLEMAIPDLMNLFIICSTVVMMLMLLISIIPYWRLSRLGTSNLSKGKTKGQPVLRRMAVTLQLAVSVVFIIAAGVVMMQMRFINHKDLGFDQSGLIQLSGLPPYMKRELRTALIDKIAAIPQVEIISTSNFEPQHNAKTVDMISKVKWPGKSTGDETTFNVIPTDYRFAETFGLKMIAGEWFKEGALQKVVLNEEAARVMQLSEPVGTTIRMSIEDVDMVVEGESTLLEYEIVGVVNNFHTLSLRSNIYPTIFWSAFLSSRITADNILYIHVVPGQEQEVIRQITPILTEIDPSFAGVNLTTLHQLYDSFNHSEQAGLKMFSLLASVCLLISLFGIYAVANASTQHRRKEVAIRKVIGAEVSEIVSMFFREYFLLVIIAGLFALPLAYIAMNNWLQGYAYRTNIPWWLLAGVIIGIVAVVLLTVLGQVLKAANSNPAEVVKSE